MTIAFFDLDRTLLSVNSAGLWLRREMRLGHLGRREGLKGAWWVALYQTGLVPMEQVIQRTIATLEGQPAEELATRTRAFWAEELATLVRPGARRALEHHRSQGHRLVLLTSSSCYLGQEACGALGLDACLANRFEVHDGVFTGRSLGTLCYGQGKLVLARQEAQEQGVSLSSCWFYTDSTSDLCVLQAVGNPVVVAPDPRLRRLALKSGWPIESWE